MGRTSASNTHSLINRTVRAKLSPNKEPYWHLIAEGQYLGYRKTGEDRGKWIARYYVQEDDVSRYRFQTLQPADDTIKPNNVNVLSFSQAVEHAQKWFKLRSLANAAGVTIGPYTVSDAANAWLDGWDGSETSKQNSVGNLKHHILPTLGTIEVAKLTTAMLQKWLNDLPKKPPVKVQQREAALKKLSPSRQSKVVYDPSDPETQRKRKDTANRIFNDLSALLTLSFEHGHVVSKAIWERVKKFDGVGVAKNEYFTLEEANAFIEACPQDFRDLVQVALITGCRYKDASTLKAGSYDPQLRAIALIQGKTKRLNRFFLTDDEAALFEKHIVGKASDDLLFIRADGQPWKKSNQQPRMKAALKVAGIKRHVRYQDLRHTLGTLLAMNGTAMPLIARQLGHASTRITEKHYAHFDPAYVATTIRANKPSFGFAGAGARQQG